jgi:hypothetical protein
MSIPMDVPVPRSWHAFRWQFRFMVAGGCLIGAFIPGVIAYAVVSVCGGAR